MVFQSIFSYNVNKLLKLKYDSFRWSWLEVCSVVCFRFMAYLVRINKKINIVIKLNKGQFSRVGNLLLHLVCGTH